MRAACTVYIYVYYVADMLRIFICSCDFEILSFSTVVYFRTIRAIFLLFILCAKFVILCGNFCGEKAEKKTEVGDKIVTLFFFSLLWRKKKLRIMY